MQPLWELLRNNMRRTLAAHADCACFANHVATHLAIDNSRSRNKVHPTVQSVADALGCRPWKTSNFGGPLKDRPPHLDRRSLGTVRSSKQHASTGKMSVTARPQEQKEKPEDDTSVRFPHLDHTGCRACLRLLGGAHISEDAR